MRFQSLFLFGWERIRSVNVPVIVLFMLFQSLFLFGWERILSLSIIHMLRSFWFQSLFLFGWERIQSWGGAPMPVPSVFQSLFLFGWERIPNMIHNEFVVNIPVSILVFIWMREDPPSEVGHILQFVQFQSLFLFGWERIPEATETCLYSHFKCFNPCFYLDERGSHSIQPMKNWEKSGVSILVFIWMREDPTKGIWQKT